LTNMQAESARLLRDGRMFAAGWLIIFVATRLVGRGVMTRTGVVINEPVVFGVVLGIWGGGWARVRFGASLTRTVVAAGISAAGAIVVLTVLRVFFAYG
jgi:hypothetical protein